MTPKIFPSFRAFLPALVKRCTMKWTRGVRTVSIPVKNADLEAVVYCIPTVCVANPAKRKKPRMLPQMSVTERSSSSARRWGPKRRHAFPYIACLVVVKKPAPVSVLLPLLERFPVFEGPSVVIVVGFRSEDEDIHQRSVKKELLKFRERAEPHQIADAARSVIAHRESPRFV